MAKTIKFNNRYNHDRPKGLDCSNDPSRTKQEFLDDVGINDIIARHQERGIPPRTMPTAPMYGDFSDERLMDYAKALDTVRGVGQLMMELPAKVRARFANDPANILMFVSDPANRQEAISLGLIEADNQAVIQRPPEKPETPPQTPKANP